MTARARIAGAVAAALVATAAGAGDAEGWRVVVAPHAFLPVSTTGTSTVAGRSADIDLDLRDVFEVLNFAATGRVEGWHGDFGVILDGYHTNIGGDAVLLGPGGRASVRVNVTTEQAWLALPGGRCAHEGGWGDWPTALDLGAGVRFNRIEQEVDAAAEIDLGRGFGPRRSLGGAETFVEPQVSPRVELGLAPDWWVALRDDLSGFGVAGDDPRWLLLVGAERRASEHVALRVGWQVYGIDFATDRDDGRFACDVVRTGPHLGLAYRFRGVPPWLGTPQTPARACLRRT